MKRQLLSLLAFLVVLTGTAQTIGEAFYVYRSDGMINTFFRSEVDSMSYSYYDVDSTYYDEVVTQVIYTPDSIYRIPLAMVDSVGFVTPETKYQPGVVKLEGTIRDYIIGSDSLTVFFRSDTPSDILPKVGDKLVTTEMSEVFIAGFAGEVDNIKYVNDSITVNCISIGLDEIFEVFYCSNDDNYNISSKNNSRKKVAFPIIDFSPGTFNFSLSNQIGSYIKAEKFGVSLEENETSFDFSTTPTYSSRGSLIIHPFWGVVLTLDVFTKYILTEHFSFSGSLNYSPNLDKDILTYPIPAFPFVQVYGKVGPLFKAELKGSINENWSQTLRYHFHYENATNPLFFPVLIVGKGNNSYNHEGQCTLEGFLNGGVRGEIGLKVLDSKFAGAGFGFETGLKLSGDVLITEEMRNTALTSTDLYNKLKKGLDLDFFFDLGVKAKLFSWLETGAKWPIIDKQVDHFNIVPTFTNTLLLRDSDIPSTLKGYTFPKDKVILPVDLGFRLFKGNETEGLGNTICRYKDGPQELSITYEGESVIDKYEVYPTVNLFGLEMLAEPSAEIEAELRPITFGISNVTDTSATGLGQINRYELMDETMSYGLAYREAGSSTTTFCPASSINTIGIFMKDFENLKPNTLYEYFAYLECGGKSYEGTKELFTTEGKREPYYVWDGANKTATYYYDDKRESRGGRIINEEHRVDNVSPTILTVNFNSSFSRYNPKRFLFCWCRDLKTIRNLKYLNTDSITNMENMFFACNSLTSLDLSHFNTSNVTSMYGMFSGCSSLTHLNVSNFNTSKVTSIGNMFSGCSSITVLDLNNFRFNNGVWLSQAFANCSSLETIYAEDWHSGGVWTPAIFVNCPNLTGGKGTKLGVNYYYDEKGNLCSYICRGDYGSSARPDGGKDSPGLFTEK